MTTFKGLNSKVLVLIGDGEPCYHTGCLSHITHPCEGCGRIQGKGKVEVEIQTRKENETNSHN